MGETPQEPVSVVWESNGRVEPHKVWIYADGKKPESGLCSHMRQLLYGLLGQLSGKTIFLLKSVEGLDAHIKGVGNNSIVIKNKYFFFFYISYVD